MMPWDWYSGQEWAEALVPLAILLSYPIGLALVGSVMFVLRKLYSRLTRR